MRETNKLEIFDSAIIRAWKSSRDNHEIVVTSSFTFHDDLGEKTVTDMV